MGSRVVPVVGQWYAHRDKGGLFQVVAVDDELGTVDIQEFDGDVDELDLESWRQLGFEEAAPPEDWGGPVDVEPDEFGYTDLEAAEGEPGGLAATSWEQVVEEEDEEPDVYAERTPRPGAHASRPH